ncbi:copper amine oxidase N-terminal domain-containing protein [Paenibacillus polymyxa]|uniref:copper amine oxidase N-terminal domain-containing protein n=1 Tax=Paenibacillus polymyxa TaxID=1406 RepID=UPI0025B67CEC|nr:copper amine oxidase N-terminal domain-containing protein [Paenibacillus polymyxa]MDN4081199.1 copper amine oxidase N-terminal domain-containing protein [Paenibacillus polymyxa]MDN4106901.1 copper amine oxidase N-terminal domain-containing protein [Paenibacillus polymyxa]MDN4116839.1 copper amine oxidase N-terminal domain-containing protein [Paenibacillus polymyxa]
MKKVIVFVFFFVLTFQSWAIADAAKPISVNAVNVNGKFIATDVSPIIKDGRVLVPIRTLASLGVTYQWDSKSQSALITKGKDQIKLTANKKEAFKNNQAVQVDVPVQMTQGRILVPIRFVSENFGYKANYEKIRSILFIQDSNYKVDQESLQAEDLQTARQAAISLPVQSSFKSLSSLEKPGANEDYGYAFPRGDSSRYMYSNNVGHTVVEIKNGVAKAVWQFTEGNGLDDIVSSAGQRPSYNYVEWVTDIMMFNDENGNIKAVYKDDKGQQKDLSVKAKSYTDIIQSIPNETSKTNTNKPDMTQSKAKVDLSLYYSPDKEAVKEVTSDKITWKENEVTFIADKKKEDKGSISTMNFINKDRNLKIQIDPKPDNIFSVSLSSTKKYVAVALRYSYGNKLMLVNLSNGKYFIFNDVLKSKNKGTVESISANNWSPDGKKIAFRYGDTSTSKLAIYDVENNTFSYPPLQEAYVGVYRIMWLKDGKSFDYIADFPTNPSLKLYRYNLIGNSINTISSVTKDELSNMDKIGPTLISE